MAALQAPPSLGFSRQGHWSGVPFPSPTHESESEVTQSCPTLGHPMDCSLPGSSAHESVLNAFAYIQLKVSQVTLRARSTFVIARASPGWQRSLFVDARLPVS